MIGKHDVSAPGAVRACLGILLAAALLLPSTPAWPQAARSAFAGLSGSWSGDGTVVLANGAKEPIRCRATYVTGRSERTLHNELNCEREQLRFEIVLDLTLSSGRIGGTWLERTRDMRGTISGEAAAGRIRGVVTAPNYAASVIITTRGRQQSVLIRPQENEIVEVAIEMRKR